MLISSRTQLLPSPVQWLCLLGVPVGSIDVYNDYFCKLPMLILPLLCYGMTNVYTQLPCSTPFLSHCSSVGSATQQFSAMGFHGLGGPSSTTSLVSPVLLAQVPQHHYTDHSSKLPMVMLPLRYYAMTNCNTQLPCSTPCLSHYSLVGSGSWASLVSMRLVAKEAQHHSFPWCWYFRYPNIISFHGYRGPGCTASLISILLAP